MEKKKYTTGINTNICSGYIDKHIQNPLQPARRKKKSCYHAVSKRTAGMRVELAKKDPNVEKEEEDKRNSQHS